MGKVYSQPACRLAHAGDVRGLSSLAARHPRCVDVRDQVTGDTPLIAACRRGHLHAAAFLMERGADVRARNKKRRTCLHYVAKQNFSLLDHLMVLILMPILLLGYFLLLQKRRRNLALMELLLDSEVDVDAADDKGNTALHYACLRKRDHLVPPLLLRDADPHLQNRDGESPLDVAVRLKFAKVVRLLRKTR
ncbi:ankyrin repeat domain-containing protein 22 isoform X2 [Stigmatopora nigra]